MATGNIVTASVSIRGLRPILWHAFGPDAIPLETRKERTGVAGNDPEEWKKTVLVTKEGQLYVKPTYVFGMLREAAKYTKEGRASLQVKASATLQVLEDKVLVKDRFLPDPIPVDTDEPVYLDITSVRNPATKARNVRYRVAASKGWELDFNIQFDRTIVSTVQMQSICNDAGALVGLADGRSIGFGRFEVVNFTISD